MEHPHRNTTLIKFQKNKIKVVLVEIILVEFMQAEDPVYLQLDINDKITFLLCCKSSVGKFFKTSNGV